MKGSEGKNVFKAYAAWLAVCFFWGTTYLAIRISVESLPPALLAGVRFTLAGLILLLFLRLRRHPIPPRRELGDIAVVGIALLTIANGLVVWSEQWVPSGLAALIVATLPFWMVGLESLLPDGEKISLQKAIGIMVGFGGLILLLGPDLGTIPDLDYVKGVLALLLASFSWAAGSVYAKYRVIRTTPLMAAALQMIIAGTVLLLIAAVSGDYENLNPTGRGLLAVLYLMIFGSIVGHTCFVYALANLPSSTVSMYAYINPIIAVVLGNFVLGERLDWTVVAATTVILMGVLLVQRSPRDRVR
jgi:drug/metabolite transporter (DMT)-like permease